SNYSERLRARFKLNLGDCHAAQRLIHADTAFNLSLEVEPPLPHTSPTMQKEHARALLRQMLGPATDFRDGQWDAIDLAANQRQRILVVQRTGWGKSVVYFLAAKIL